MNQIVKMDQIEEFNSRVTALLARADSTILRIVLVARPRMVEDVLYALQLYCSAPFKRQELKTIENGDRITDPITLEKMADVEEARRLIELYATIMGAPAVEHVMGEWFEWRELNSDAWAPWLDTNEVDTITV